MRKATASANGAGVPANDDEVVSLAEMLGEARKREQELQERWFDAKNREKDEVAAGYLDTAAQTAVDRTEAIRNLIACTPAQSFAGAAVQMLEVLTRLDLLFDQIPKDRDGYEVRQDYRAAMRLLFSALRVADSAADRTIADILGDEFHNAHRDPWLDPDEQLKWRESGQNASAL